MQRNYLLDCFIIKRINYREVDKLITVFSRQKGKIILKARGIRKISSKRSGSLELCNQTRILVVKGRGDMDVITEVALDRDFSILGREFYRTKIAYELLELVNTFAPEHAENEALYELLQKALEFVASQDFNTDIADKASLRFKTRMLDLLGYGLHSNLTHSRLNEIIEELSERKLHAHQSFSL